MQREQRLKAKRLFQVESMAVLVPLLVASIGASSALAQDTAPAGNTPGATVVTPATPDGAVPAPMPTVPAIPSPPPEPTAGLADARNQISENVAPISIEEAITLALRNNPQREAAIAALQAARARIGTARAAGGPQLGVGAGVNLNRSFGGSSSGGSGNFTGVGGVGGTGSGNTNNNSSSNSNGFLGFSNNESVSATADIPVYTGGRVSSGKRVAEAGARFQAAQTLQVEQDLVLSTIEAYLGVLRTGQLLEVAESNLTVSRERRRVEQVRYDAGASARLDVLRADTTLAEAQQQRIAASNNLAQSKAALNTLMGRVPEAPLRTELITTLTPRVPLPPEIAVTTAPGATVPASASSAELRSIAERSRPAIAAGEAQVEAGEAGIDVAKAQRKPSLGLSLTGLLRNPVSFAGRFALGIGLNIAQTLFDSGRARSQIDEARALAEQARQNLGNQRLNVANQIEQALLSLDSAQKRQGSADVAVVAAAEALRAAQLGYDAGARTQLEVSDAQVALLTAQTDAVNARFQAAQSQADLSAAVGVLTTEGQAAYQQALTDEAKQAETLAAQTVQPKKKRKKFLGIF